jgi:hypothetical protein
MYHSLYKLNWDMLYRNNLSRTPGRIIGLFKGNGRLTMRTKELHAFLKRILVASFFLGLVSSSSWSHTPATPIRVLSSSSSVQRAGFLQSWVVNCTLDVNPGTISYPGFFSILFPVPSNPSTIQVDNDSIYLTSSNSTTENHIARYNLAGVLQWRHPIKAFDPAISGTPKIALDNDGNVLILSTVNGTMAAIVSISPAGTLTRTIHWQTTPITRLHDIATTTTGETLASGCIQVNDTNWNPFVVMFGGTGDVVWNATWDDGRDGVFSTNIATTIDGATYVGGVQFAPIRFYLTNVTYSPPPYFPSYTNEFLARLNQSGHLEWYNSTLPGRDITVDEAGNAFVFGSVLRDSGGGVFQAIAKISPTGMLVWNNTRCEQDGLRCVSLSNIQPHKLSYNGGTLCCVGLAWTPVLSTQGSTFGLCVMTLDTDDGDFLFNRSLTGYPTDVVDACLVNDSVYIDSREFYSREQYLIKVEPNYLPTINHPQDIQAVQGTVGINATWVISDTTVEAPTYTVLADGVPFSNGIWSPEQPVNIATDNLAPGTHEIMIVVDDGSGVLVSDSIVVTIEPFGVYVMRFVAGIAIGGIALTIFARATAPARKRLIEKRKVRTRILTLLKRVERSIEAEDLRAARSMLDEADWLMGLEKASWNGATRQSGRALPVPVRGAGTNVRVNRGSSKPTGIAQMLDRLERRYTAKEREISLRLEQDFEEITTIVASTPEIDARADQHLLGRIEHCIDVCVKADFARLLVRFVSLKRGL